MIGYVSWWTYLNLLVLVVLFMALGMLGSGKIRYWRDDD